MTKQMLPDDQTLIDLYVNKKMFLKEICRMYGLSHNSSGNLSRRLKKIGVEIRKMRGENHNCWKGGVISKGDNYVGIWTPNHPRADNQGYVYEHTLVYEKHNGCLPQENEVLHHIDLNKKNNDIKNLYLCGHREHATIHRSIENIIEPLLENQIIIFDDGCYKLNGIVVDVFAKIIEQMKGKNI